MASFSKGTSFSDGVTGDVTAAKLHALVDAATPVPGFITDRTAETSIATDDVVLISDTSESGALNKMTVENLFKAPLTGTINSTAGTITAATIPTLTAGTTTGTAATFNSGTITTLNSTTGTITTGVIPTLTAGTTTSTAATITNGTITTLNSTTGTITTGAIPTLTAGTTTSTAATITNGTITTGVIQTLTAGTTTSTAATINTATIAGGTINNATIGATTPSSGVFSSCDISLAGNPLLRFIRSGTADLVAQCGASYSIIGTEANLPLHLQTNSTVRLIIGADGVLDSNATYNNTNAGAANVVVTSDGLIRRSSSSIKYKKDVENLYSSIVDNAISNLRPVWYRSKDPNGDDKQEWSHIGLIAEEVAQVEPRLVCFKTMEAGFDENKNKTITHLDAPIPENVDYARLAVILLAEVQSQRNKISNLETRIAALESA